MIESDYHRDGEPPLRHADRTRARAAPPIPRHHPSGEDLAAYVLGDCSPGTALLVERHGVDCPSCRERLIAFGCQTEDPSPAVVGAWRVVAPGVQEAFLGNAAGLGEVVFFLRMQPGARIQTSGRHPLAEVLVCDGAVYAGDEGFAPADFFSAQARGVAALIADDELGCCLLATASDV